VSIGARLSSVVDRVAAFHGFLGEVWRVWLRAARLAVGVPPGVGVGLWRALERD
jgi:hypothetical protein